MSNACVSKTLVLQIVMSDWLTRYRKCDNFSQSPIQFISISIITIAQFPFVDWAELLEACHSMSKQNSPQEKLIKKHERGLLCTIVRLKMPSNAIRYPPSSDQENSLSGHSYHDSNQHAFLKSKQIIKQQLINLYGLKESE